MVNLIFTSGPTFQGSSAILLAIETEFGWSRAVIGGVASFGRFGGTLFGPFEGFLTDRVGPARMMLYGLILGGIGFIFLSQINSIPTYYAAFLVLSLGTSMGGFVPSVTAVNRWLPKRRATGIALVVGGSSLAGLVVPALAWGIDAHGWRTTMFWIGVLFIVSSPFFWWALSRRDFNEPDPPEPTSSDETQSNAEGPSDERWPDFSAKEALRTKAFWIISGTHSMINFSTAAVSAHLLLHLNDVGIDKITAATIIPVMAIVAFVFQMTGGFIGDRFEKRFPIAVFTAIQGTGVLILAFTDSYSMAIVFAIVWGIGFGGRTPILHALRGEYFGSKAFATILGLSSVMMGAAMSLAPFLVGLQFDLQDTYKWSFIILAALGWGASGLILFASRPIHPSVRAVELREASVTAS